MNRRRAHLVLLFAALLGGCSDTPTTGGGGFEGETVALAGSVRFAGRQLAHAGVVFSDLRTGERVNGTTTDTTGRFELVVPAASRGFLEVRGGDSALARRLVETIDGAPLALEADRPVNWRATLAMGGTTVAGAAVRIVGSTESVTTGSDGSFALRRVPGAVEWADVRLRDGSRRQVKLPDTATSTLSPPDHAVLLLDDFEGPGTRTALGWAAGSGWWFALTDSAPGSASYFAQTGLSSDARKGYFTQSAYAGTSFQATFLTDDNQPVRWAIAGIVLAPTGQWVDLARLDSITFLASGLGSVRLEIATRTSLVPDNDVVGKFGVDLDIPTTWSRVVVRKGDLAAPPGSRPVLQGIPWAQDARRCGVLLFLFKSSADLRIDDIVLHGPGLGDLVPEP